MPTDTPGADDANDEAQEEDHRAESKDSPVASRQRIWWRTMKQVREGKRKGRRAEAEGGMEGGMPDGRPGGERERGETGEGARISSISTVLRALSSPFSTYGLQSPAQSCR